jgi:hypothetical protein
VRSLSEEEIENLKEHALDYVELMKRYKWFRISLRIS